VLFGIVAFFLHGHGAGRLVAAVPLHHGRVLLAILIDRLTDYFHRHPLSNRQGD
jgi:hypothetical protein